MTATTTISLPNSSSIPTSNTTVNTTDSQTRNTKTFKDSTTNKQYIPLTSTGEKMNADNTSDTSSTLVDVQTSSNLMKNSPIHMNNIKKNTSSLSSSFDSLSSMTNAINHPKKHEDQRENMNQASTIHTPSLTRSTSGSTLTHALHPSSSTTSSPSSSPSLSHHPPSSSDDIHESEKIEDEPLSLSESSVPSSSSTTVKSTKSGSNVTTGPRIKNTPSSSKPNDITKLIESKISQLTTETLQEDEEEKMMLKAIKKASKDITLLVKSFATCPEQLEALQQKYMDIFTDYKRTEKELMRLKRMHDVQTKERDALKATLSRTSLQKQRIESLCRELQKQLHQVKEESKSVVQEIKEETKKMVLEARQEAAKMVHEEQSKRDLVSARFASTVLEIKEKMQMEMQNKRRKEQEFRLLKEKFKHFMEQYDIREQHMQSVVQTKDLEVSLLKAKLEETEMKMREQKVLVESLQHDLETAASVEKQLMEQQCEWAEKFKHIEQEVKRYNPLVHSIKQEMERTNVRNDQLQRDNHALKMSGETLVQKMMMMAEEKSLLESKLNKITEKNSKLDSLCRALQSDRQKLLTRNKLIETRIRKRFGDLAETILSEQEEQEEEEEMMLNGLEQADGIDDVMMGSANPILDDDLGEVNGKQFNKGMMMSSETLHQEPRDEEEKKTKTENGHDDDCLLHEDCCSFQEEDGKKKKIKHKEDDVFEHSQQSEKKKQDEDKKPFKYFSSPSVDYFFKYISPKLVHHQNKQEEDNQEDDFVVS